MGEEEGGGRDGGVPNSQASSNILCSFVFVGRLVVGGVIRVPGKWFVFLKHAFSWERHSQLNKSDWLSAKLRKQSRDMSFLCCMHQIPKENIELK